MKRGSLVLSLICVLVISGCTSNLDKSGEKHRYNLVDPNDGWPAALFLEECDAQLQMIGDTNMNLVVNVVLEDNSGVLGLGEESMKDLQEGDVVQLERNYFARVDKKEGNKIIFYYLHK